MVCICTCARAHLLRTMVPPRPLVHRRSRRHTGILYSCDLGRFRPVSHAPSGVLCPVPCVISAPIHVWRRRCRPSAQRAVPLSQSTHNTGIRPISHVISDEWSAPAASGRRTGGLQAATAPAQIYLSVTHRHRRRRVAPPRRRHGNERDAALVRHPPHSCHLRREGRHA